MKFLTDQDVYGTTVRALSGAGHDLVTASQLGLAQAADHELLRGAQQQGRERSWATRRRRRPSHYFWLGFLQRLCQRGPRTRTSKQVMV